MAELLYLMVIVGGFHLVLLVLGMIAEVMEKVADKRRCGIAKRKGT